MGPCGIAALTLLLHLCGAAAPAPSHRAASFRSHLLCAFDTQAARALDRGLSESTAPVDAGAEDSWAPASGEAAVASSAGNASVKGSSNSSPEVKCVVVASVGLACRPVLTVSRQAAMASSKSVAELPFRSQDRLKALEDQLRSAPAAASDAAKTAAEAAEAALADTQRALERKAEAQEVAAALRQESDALAK